MRCHKSPASHLGQHLVVDAVPQARHRGKDGGTQLLDVLKQLKNVATAAARGKTAASMLLTHPLGLAGTFHGQRSLLSLFKMAGACGQAMRHPLML